MSFRFELFLAPIQTIKSVDLQNWDIQIPVQIAQILSDATMYFNFPRSGKIIN